MTATHDHPVHPAVYKAKARASLAHAAGDKFRDLRDKLQEDADEMYDYGDEQGDRLITAHARTADDAASIAFETSEALYVCADELRALEAEVARLRAELEEAEERAAGPFFASCGLAVAYGRRLDVALNNVIRALRGRLEDWHDPDVWAAVVAGWECKVEHGVHLSPYLDDDGEPSVCVASRQGFWWYDLRLTVTNGRPVLTAERRAEGAR